MKRGKFIYGKDMDMYRVVARRNQQVIEHVTEQIILPQELQCQEQGKRMQQEQQVIEQESQKQKQIETEKWKEMGRKEIDRNGEAECWECWEGCQKQDLEEQGRIRLGENNESCRKGVQNGMRVWVGIGFSENIHNIESDAF